MIVERALLLIVAAAAIAAAATVSVFALALAIFALIAPHIGPAGAAGAVALIFALAIGLVGLTAALRARGPRRAAAERESLGLAERVMDLIRDKPFAAAGVAAAVGLFAMRNPRMIGAILRAFLDGWAGPEKKR